MTIPPDPTMPDPSGPTPPKPPPIPTDPDTGVPASEYADKGGA